MIRNYCSISLVILIWLFTTVSSADTGIRFGLYSTDRPTDVVRDFAPILLELEKKLTKQLNTPIKIKLDISKTYEMGRQKIIDGSVDFMRLGAASYVLAKKAQPEIEIIAMELNDGQKVFNGVIVVNNESDIKDINDLSGKSFAFGDKTSTIGRYLSQQYLLEHGINAAELSYYEYVGRHDKVGLAVANNLFDAGALKESTFKKLVNDGKALRTIANFPVPTKPWIVRKGLSQDIRNALTKGLISIKSEDGQADRFTEGLDQDFDLLRLSIKNNFVFFEP